MQLEISSSPIEIWEDMEEKYDTRDKPLREKRYKRRVNFGISPSKDSSLTFKTGEIFMNPDEIQWSEDSDKNDEDDDWEGKPRISCLMELHEDDEDDERGGHTGTDIYFQYHPKYEDDLGSKTPSSLFLVSLNSVNIIQSMIENLRNNIRPKLINVDFENHEHLELGFGSKRLSQYAWDNSILRKLKIENLSIMYSI